MLLPATIIVALAKSNLSFRTYGAKEFGGILFFY
jgi:hypothetical protein